MVADELSAPLGQDKRPRPRRNGLPFLQVVAAALGALAITFAGWAMLVEDPLGGEPVATAPVDLATISNANAQKPDPAVPKQNTQASRTDDDALGNEPATIRLPPSRTITIIDGMSGTRKEITIPGPADPDGAEQPVAARPARGGLPKSGSDARVPARTISVR